jgi:outer membrane receptor for ferrienterochelin and colicins
VLSLFTAIGRPAWAQDFVLPAGHDGKPLQIEDLNLEDLLNPAISVATKSSLHASQTPAVVTVVSADEIAARGYTSLAEVMRSVPGFYDVYDGVTHNIGIRGINGGQNASGGGLKLMIDGQPVDYRPSTGNFFGEELIPLEAVERVEIIRGPASALYGADAFLGVINVVTRSGRTRPGLALVGQGALVGDRPGGGGGLVLAGKSGGLEVLLAANYLFLDRSGLGLPASSPLLPNAAVAMRSPTRQDYSRPGSVLAKVALDDVLTGRVTLLASIQRLDSHGAYQYFGPLDSRTRITALNQNYRLSYDVNPADNLSFSVTGNYFNSAPTSDARLSLGRNDYVMLPAEAATGSRFTADGHLTLRALTLTAGGDVLFERSTIETYDQKLLEAVHAPDGTVLRAAGTIIPGEMHGTQTSFRNLGAFAQAMVTPGEAWTAIAGLRIDDHNIYGAQVSARAGVVYAHEALSLKLLYGSSFKAPSAEQLYARPVAFGGVLGNPNLRAQTAQSGEVACGIRLPEDRGDIQVNAFVTRVRGRVEFLPTGSYVIANNTQDELVVGGELASHLVPVRHLRVSLLASTAQTIARSGTIEGLIGKPLVDNPLFPEYETESIVDYTLPWAGLRVSTELGYVGPRESSFSNSVINGKSYDLDAYLFSALAVSAGGAFTSPSRPTRVALRISDVLNRRWVEPGFGGLDVPTRGVTATLTVVQGL